MPELRPSHVLRAARRRPPSTHLPLNPRFLATAVASLPTLSNPPFRDTLPSSFATSSKVALDAFPVGEKGILIDDDPIASFGATDQDLINAILLSTHSSGSPFSPQWTSTIDPAFAYLCLRRRSTYFPFLQIVWPHMNRLHDHFRPSTVFQLLITDLLLWNPNAEGLRGLLELEANGDGHLRPNHIVSIFNLIHADLLSEKLPPMSRKAYMLVSKALIGQDEVDMLPDVWRCLFAITPWEPEGAWALFNIILHLVRHGAVESTLPLVQLLVEGGLVSESLFGKSNPKHPEAKVLLVQSIVLRCCLEFKLYVRSQMVAEELADMMERSGVASSAVKLLLETCRATFSGQKVEEFDWAGAFMKRLIKIDGFPLLPGYLLDMYIESIPDTSAVEYYMSLTESKRPTPSPQTILKLAAGRPTRANFLELMPLVNRIPPADFFAQRPAFLGYLAEAGLPRLTRTLYDRWKDSFVLDADLMLSLVRCFAPSVAPSTAKTKKGNQPHQEPRESINSARSIIADFARVATVTPRDRLALARAHLLLNDSASAQLVLSSINASDPQLASVIDDLATQDIIAAVDILRVSAEVKNPLGSTPAMISRACSAGHWEILNRVPPAMLPKAARREVAILGMIRSGKFGAALGEIEAMSVSVPHTTYLCFVDRALLLREWDYGIRAWLKAVDAFPDRSEMLVEQGEALLRKRSLSLGENGALAEIAESGEGRMDAVKSEFGRLRESKSELRS